MMLLLNANKGKIDQAKSHGSFVSKIIGITPVFFVFFFFFFSFFNICRVPRKLFEDYPVCNCLYSGIKECEENMGLVLRLRL